MSRGCSVCESPQVKKVDTLLGTGSSLRQVARISEIPRSTLARHRAHVQVRPSRLALIRTEAGPDGTGGPLDPLTEALALAQRARTAREVLKAAEATRAATALQVRALRGADADADALEQLDANIAEAATLYRRVGGSFENELRALAGHREAIRQRLEAVRTPGTIEVPVTVTTASGQPLPYPDSKPGTWKLTPEQYFDGVPTRYRDPDRFTVSRTIQVRLGAESAIELKLYEVATGGIVWAKEGRAVSEGRGKER
jgi:hypothetical protein